AFKAKLKSLDTKEAEALPNVTVVRDGEFVGAVAPTEQAAAEAVSVLKAEWQTVPQPSSENIFKYLKEHTGGGRGAGGFGGRGGGNANQGSMEEGLRSAAKTLRATYTV